MSLAHPWWLALWALLPLAAWLRRRAARSAAAPFSDGAALNGLPPGRGAVGERAREALWLLAAAALIVALARPQRGLAQSRVRAEALDIVLAADVSTSMEALDMSTATRRMNRLDAAREVMRRFIADRPDDRIALLAFAALPYTIAPLTLDHGWLAAQLDRLRTGMVEDGTAIGSAIGAAVNRLRDSRAKSKIVIVLTDGMNNRGEITPENAAQAAKALGVRVYTVGAGTRGLAPYPVRDPFGGERMVPTPVEIDEELLRRVAQTTGGKYFRATDFSSLNEVYAEIDRLEKTEIEMDRFTRHEERFMPWLWAGLGLLVIERCLGLSRWGALP